MAKRMNGPLLYHSFPKPSPEGIPRPPSDGVTQLKLMIEYGMLLTPECLHIPLRDRKPVNFQQVRACFTLLRREELWTSKPTYGGAYSQTHMERFGSFAIGIDPISARALGMGPVSYIYAAPKGSTNITIELLCNQWELRSLAIIMAAMEWEADIEGHRPVPPAAIRALGYHSKEIRRKWKEIKYASKDSIREAASYLDIVRKSAWSLADTIDLGLCFYQTTDGRDPLDNFQLREWRIPQFRHDEAILVPLRRASGRLIDLRKRLRRFGVDRKTLKKCMIFEGLRDGKFFSFVDEVICPTCVADEVQIHLAGLDFRRVKDGVPSGFVVFQRSSIQSSSMPSFSCPK